MKIKCNGQDILSNNFTDKDKRKLDSVQPCANNYKHPIIDGYKHLPKGGKEGQVITHDGTSATWKNFMDFIPNKDDLFAYGVQFDTTIGDPHLTRIGNLSLHKSLPIQSQLKGCIAKGGEVQYWLDENDWRFKKDPEITTSTISSTKDEYIITIAGGNINKFDNQWIKINGVPGQIVGLYSNNVYLVAKNTALNNLGLAEGQSVQVELGAILNGYDGTVRVYIPEFYIKSTVIDTICKVLISTIKVDNTYTKQPAALVDAYKCTVLNTVPSNMGYLSTLPVNSAVSIVNTATYCRGYTGYDSYIDSDIFRTGLNKPIQGKTLSTYITYSKNAKSNLLNYCEYKNIFYWLYIIEYANFNCQEDFIEELDSQGFKQGGLGAGITNTDRLNWYNQSDALTPNGFGNLIGNGTGLTKMTIPQFTYNSAGTEYNVPEQIMYVPRWRGFDNPFGDIGTILAGILYKKNGTNEDIYICIDPNKYSNNIGQYSYKITIEACLAGYIQEFNLGTEADIIPKKTGNLSSKFMRDYYTRTTAALTRCVRVGGFTDSQNQAGLSYINTTMGATSYLTHTGCRTISNFISAPQNN